MKNLIRKIIAVTLVISVILTIPVSAMESGTYQNPIINYYMDGDKVVEEASAYDSTGQLIHFKRVISPDGTAVITLDANNSQQVIENNLKFDYDLYRSLVNPTTRSAAFANAQYSSSCIYTQSPYIHRFVNTFTRSVSRSEAGWEVGIMVTMLSAINLPAGILLGIAASMSDVLGNANATYADITNTIYEVFIYDVGNYVTTCHHMTYMYYDYAHRYLGTTQECYQLQGM